MTRILVTAASKHGATAEIAEAIAEVLAGNGLDPAVVPPEEVGDVADIVTLTGARDHRLFAGKLTRKQLSFPERAIVSALHVPEGDFRHWPEIRRWATEIATTAADIRR